MRDTIYIDTSDVDLIMENMDSKNRNMVRKGIKNNISIECKDITDIEGFIPIYTGTMTNKCADDYYIFQDDYFKYLSNIKENACVFYALYEGRIIGGSIMFFNDRYMHYHLSGSDIEYRKYSPNNLLLYEAACWASKKGIKQFHLGGGLSPNDSLFGYKKQFNKNGALEFYIGRTIFNKAAYDELMTTRKKVDELFDVNNGFMIQYRA